MFHLVIALFIAFLGYLIKCKKISWLIAGYNTASKEAKDKIDEAALCTAVGNFIFLLSAGILVGAAGEILSLKILINAGWLLFAIVTIGEINNETDNRLFETRGGSEPAV